MKIKLINKSRHPLPQYETGQSAAVDLRANIDSPLLLASQDRQLVPTGLYIALPAGYEAQVRPRSGLALKYGLTVLNSPGTVDADYRGELGVILINLGSEPYTIQDGDRIAQLVLAKHETIEWNEVEMLDETDRQTGGFGSTGR